MQTLTQNSDLKVRPTTEKLNIFIVDLLLKTLDGVTQVIQRGCSGRITVYKIVSKK